MIRFKRQYQAWVANETLEDYSLRYAAKSFRRFSPSTLANTALGGISFLALEAIGGAVTVSVGFANAVPAILLVSLLIFITNLPIAHYSGKYNIDMDLLTRGAGFGYIGSTITSLIYASFTFIFFALEAAIMAQALELYFEIPLPLGYVICSLVIIPITFFGVTAINKLQNYTQIIWVVLMVLPFVFVIYKEPDILSYWSEFAGHSAVGNQFDIILFGQACVVLFALVVQIGEQVDYLRFIPNKTEKNKVRWYSAIVLAGPGWIIVGCLKLLGGSLLAFLFIHNGGDYDKAVEPIQMYIQGYGYMFDSPETVLAVATFFVIVSQVKINVTNAYAGSLAWSNFFSRMTHYHPGRVVWLIFNILIALLLMLLGIFDTLEAVLSVYANLAIAWIGAIVADLLVLKPLKISPSYIEFKRAHLHNFNPVGCLSMLIASILAVVAYAGIFGELAQAYCAFIALISSFLLAILIGYITKGRYYLARTPAIISVTNPSQVVKCSVCEQEYEQEDIAHCPFHQGNICSLCCSLENHCHDQCKVINTPNQTADKEVVYSLLMQKIDVNMGRRIIRFLVIFSTMALISGAFFLLAFHFSHMGNVVQNQHLFDVIFNIFSVVLVLIAISAWWIVLSHENREMAERELLQSLNYLEITKNELVQSEKLSSLGRLVAGIAHEINTPLGICVTITSSLNDAKRDFKTNLEGGQLTKSDLDTFVAEVDEVSEMLSVSLNKATQLIRSFKQVAADQTSSLRRNFDLIEFSKELDSTLQPQFKHSSHQVHFHCDPDIKLDSFPGPLGQVITNLVTNSIKHGFEDKENGVISVTARLDEDEEHVLLIYQDDGKGIPEEYIHRVFDPFFTTKMGDGGTGLGLNIVYNIVNNVLGGTISVQSDEGCTFTIRIPLIAPHTASFMGVGNENGQ